MSRYYVLKFNRNWADEFDCQGFAVINGEHYDALNNIFNDPDIGGNMMSFNFGSNEGWEDEFTYIEFWDDLVKINITSSIHWAAMLTEVFTDPHGYYGIFPEFETLFENYMEGENELIDNYYMRMDREDFVLKLPKVINYAG